MLLFYLSMIDSPEDRAKFEALYEDYYKLLISVAYEILHNGQDAEDAVHHAYLKLIPNLGKINDVSCRQTVNFLVIMVRRICFDIYNENKKVIQIPYEDLSESDMVADDMEYHELLERVKALPDMYGDVLYLRYCEGFSVKEIAEILNITVGSAKKRLERAKQQLRILLKEQEAVIA